MQPSDVKTNALVDNFTGTIFVASGVHRDGRRMDRVTLTVLLTELILFIELNGVSEAFRVKRRAGPPGRLNKDPQST